MDKTKVIMSKFSYRNLTMTMLAILLWGASASAQSEQNKSDDVIEIASAALPSAPTTHLTLGAPIEAVPAFASPFIAVKPIDEIPHAHRFWDRENSILFAATGAAATADFFVTHMNLSGGGRELNPLVRPLAGSTAGLATNFAVETASVMAISYVFHKTGHHRLERLTSITNISTSTAAVTYGMMHR